MTKLRSGMACPICHGVPISIEKTPQGRRTCADGHVWRMIQGVPVPQDVVQPPGKVDNPGVALYVKATIGGCRMIVEAADHYGLSDDLAVKPDVLDEMTTLRVQT